MLAIFLFHAPHLLHGYAACIRRTDKAEQAKKYAVCMHRMNKAEPNRNAGCLHAQDEQSRHIQYMGPWLNLDRATGFGLSFFKKEA